MDNRSYIVLHDETEDQKDKLDEFLENNNYNYERNNDALDIYAEEVFNSIEITVIDNHTNQEIPQDTIKIDFKDHIINCVSENDWVASYSYW